MFNSYKWDELRSEQITPLLTRRVIWGQNQNLALFTFKKGCHVSAHQHPSEQVTQVLEGSLRLIVSGEEIVLGAGQVLFIQPDTPHEAFADEDALATLYACRNDTQRSFVRQIAQRLQKKDREVVEPRSLRASVRAHAGDLMNVALFVISAAGLYFQFMH